MTRPTILTTLSSNPSEITSSVPVPQPPDTLTFLLPESKPTGRNYVVYGDRFALSSLNGATNGFKLDSELNSDYSVRLVITALAARFNLFTTAL